MITNSDLTDKAYLLSNYLGLRELGSVWLH